MDNKDLRITIEDILDELDQIKILGGKKNNDSTTHYGCNTWAGCDNSVNINCQSHGKKKKKCKCKCNRKR